MEKQGAFVQLLGALRLCMQDGHATAFALQHAKTMKVNTIREQKLRENERRQLRDEQQKLEKVNKKKDNNNTVEQQTKEVPGLCHNLAQCPNHKNTHEENQNDNKVKEMFPKQLDRLCLFVQGTSMRKNCESMENKPLSLQVDKLEELVDQVETARRELDLPVNLPLVQAVKKRDEAVVQTMQTKYAKTIANLSINNRKLTKELDEEKDKSNKLQNELKTLRSSCVITKQDSTSSDDELDNDTAIYEKQDMCRIDKMGSCTSLAAVSRTIKRRGSTVSEVSTHAVIVGKTGPSVNIVNCKNVHIHQIG